MLSCFIKVWYKGSEKGDKVKFWKDKWIDVVPLMNQVDVAPEIDLNTMVFDFFCKQLVGCQETKRCFRRSGFRKLLVAQVILGVFWKTARFGNLLLM